MQRLLHALATRPHSIVFRPKPATSESAFERHGNQILKTIKRVCTSTIVVSSIDTSTHPVRLAFAEASAHNLPEQGAALPEQALVEAVLSKVDCSTVFDQECCGQITGWVWAPSGCSTFVQCRMSAQSYCADTAAVAHTLDREACVPAHHRG